MKNWQAFYKQIYLEKISRNIIDIHDNLNLVKKLN